MDNRDHLGEKLRLKELADEDRYFGERDREALASLKARQAAAEELVLRERSRGRCPRCGEPLLLRSVHDATILECQPCQGIWLHKDQLPVMTHPSGREWLDTFLRGLGWWRTFNRN
jgi:ribosomal protein L37AE/L43A